MNCGDVKLNLSAYIDDELGKDEKQKVETHLKRCESCRRHYEQLVHLGSLVRNMEQCEVDEGHVMDIITRAAKREPVPEIAWFPVTIRIAVLAAVIINIALFNLFRDYRFRAPSVSPYKPIRVESVVEMETEPVVEMSFSFPAKDTVEGFVPPEAINAVPPSYPKHLLSERIEGTVVLNIIVDEGGEVEEVDVVKSLSPDADSFVIASARLLRFEPAHIGTVPVEAVVVLNYLFKI
jgi:TonB family protein